MAADIYWPIFDQFKTIGISASMENAKKTPDGLLMK